MNAVDPIAGLLSAPESGKGLGHGLNQSPASSSERSAWEAELEAGLPESEAPTVTPIGEAPQDPVELPVPVELPALGERARLFQGANLEVTRLVATARQDLSAPDIPIEGIPQVKVEASDLLAQLKLTIPGRQAGVEGGAQAGSQVESQALNQAGNQPPVASTLPTEVARSVVVDQQVPNPEAGTAKTGAEPLPASSQTAKSATPAPGVDGQSAETVKSTALPLANTLPQGESLSSTAPVSAARVSAAPVSVAQASEAALGAPPASDAQASAAKGSDAQIIETRAIETRASEAPASHARVGVETVTPAKAGESTAQRVSDAASKSPGAIAGVNLAQARSFASQDQARGGFDSEQGQAQAPSLAQATQAKAQAPALNAAPKQAQAQVPMQSQDQAPAIPQGAVRELFETSSEFVTREGESLGSVKARVGAETRPLQAPNPASEQALPLRGSAAESTHSTNARATLDRPLFSSILDTVERIARLPERSGSVALKVAAGHASEATLHFHRRGEALAVRIVVASELAADLMQRDLPALRESLQGSISGIDVEVAGSGSQGERGGAAESGSSLDSSPAPAFVREEREEETQQGAAQQAYASSASAERLDIRI